MTEAKSACVILSPRSMPPMVRRLSHSMRPHRTVPAASRMKDTWMVSLVWRFHFFQLQPVLLQHHDHREAQAAQEHAEHQRDKDPEIGLVGHDAVRMRREAGVVERRNGVEDAVPDGLPERLSPRSRNRGIRARARARLDHHGGHDHDPEQRAHLAEPAGVVHGLLGDQLAADTKLLAHHERQQRGEGQGAQAAHEDADQDDELAEEGPVHRRGNHGQAGDADGRRPR